jgi:aspartate oxidase
MSDTKTASQQLADAIKAMESAAAQVESLKQQTREEDLATVKRLITTHAFTQTDLRGILKAKTASRAPRKSPARRKSK